MKIAKKENGIAKVRVELTSNGTPDLKHNHYTTSSTPIAWQTDIFFEFWYTTKPNVGLAAQ